MRAEEFDYDLPDRAIGQVPIEPRDRARLLVDRGPDADPVDHRVHDLPDLLEPGDLLVVNDTRVLPARLHLVKPTGGAVEVLLLEPTGFPRQWRALVRPGKRLKAGALLHLPTPQPRSHRPPPNNRGVTVRPDERRLRGSWENDGGPEVRGGGAGGDDPVVRVDEVLDDGRRVVTVLDDDLMERVGQIPLPPYITEPLADPDRYQTVFAREPGSVAAPTAGLHLTDEVLAGLVARGIDVVRIELRVGLGTFRPIATDDVEQHLMHTEWYRVDPEVWDRVRSAQRVVAVGTTVVRTLESVAATGRLEGDTSLFITRGHDWQVIDVLMTNFHVPRSSLLVLVDAFVGSRWRSLYEAALDRDYRFLSFGDAMLLHRAGPTDRPRTSEAP